MIGPSLASANRAAQGIKDLLVEALMGASLIEMGDIGVEDVGEPRLVHDEQVIETLPAYAPQETLTARVGAWSAAWRPEHLDA